MATMIKLQLPSAAFGFQSVQSLPGLAGLHLDTQFGLVLIDPKKSLYVVRSDQPVGDLDARRRLSPEIIGIYGDVRISST